MNRAAATLTIALTAVSADIAGAQDTPTATPVGRPVGVVELFTSQGCSSCPAADAVFAELVGTGKVVALAYHVDYWDYLGWKDTFGRPENTARQYEYMKSFGAQAVYTPQAVINGRRHVNGASKREIEKVLEGFGGTSHALSVEVKVAKTSSSLVIETAGARGAPSEAEVLVVYFDAPTSVEIAQGENTGRTLTYFNAVTGMQVAGMWHGKPARFEMPLRELAKNASGGCAVLLQAVNADGSPGPILGASVMSGDKVRKD